MKTSIPMGLLPVWDPSQLLAYQYLAHQHVHGYQFHGARDPILFELADMLLINAELMARILRNQEAR